MSPPGASHRNNRAMRFVHRPVLKRASFDLARNPRTPEPWVRAQLDGVVQQDAPSMPTPRVGQASSTNNDTKREWCPGSLVALVMLILDSVQVETKYPRPCRQAAQSLSIRSQPREPCFELVDNTRKVGEHTVGECLLA